MEKNKARHIISVQKFAVLNLAVGGDLTEVKFEDISK